MSVAPAVSVMIPVFNTRRFLAATLDGLLSQSFRDFEIIAIDDGSTDGSAELLSEYAQRDPRLRVISRSNKGIVHTRNELLEKARGEFVAVNDSDDISLPLRLGRQVEFLRRNPEIVCVGGYFDLIDSAGRMLTTLRPPTEDAAIQDALLAGHCAICHSCGMFRRDAAEKVGGYTTQYTYAHDLDLWLKLGEVGKLTNLPESVLRFRLHEKSVSQTKRLEQRKFAQLACEEACKRRNVTRAFEAADPWRAGEDRESRHEYALKYGWWAFNSGERRTALVYGAKAVAAMPLATGGWKLIASAALKPMGESVMSRISVVMPVYNAERYVTLTIQSILAQTYGDFEFICIDDGSKDSSLKILNDFASKDSRIRVVTRPNKGIVGTLNEGVELARGQYIARIDSDDLSDPRRFDLQVKRMDAEPNLVALGSGSIVIDPDGHKLGEFPVPLTHEEIDARNLQGRSSIHHPAVMMRADAVKKIGGYREGFCPAEDLDLWLRLAEVGRVANLPDPLLIRRLTLDGIVASTADKQTPTIRRILTDAWHRRRLAGEPTVPTITPPTKADRYRQWGWTAVKYGQRKASIRYAIKSIETDPFSGGSWRLLLSSLRGR